MIESPLMKEFAEKIELQRRRKVIEEIVGERVGKMPDSARARLEGLNDETKLHSLLLFAGVCQTLEAFLERLEKETTPPPAPVSSRRPRKR
jgi:hypothetical protein